MDAKNYGWQPFVIASCLSTPEADYVTVLGVTDLLTIQSCICAAKEAGKQVVVDMICVHDLLRRGFASWKKVCANMLAVHTGTDQQAAGRKPIDDLITMLKARRKARIAVAGGISSQTVKDYALLGPECGDCGISDHACSGSC